MKEFTVLKDRIVWLDGDITFTPDQLYDYVLRGGKIHKGIHISEFNSDIENFNKLNPSLKLGIKKSNNILDQTWDIPDEYKSINIGDYVSKKFLSIIESKKFDDKSISKRIDRIEYELKKYKEYDMNMILKTIIYIIDSFTAHNIVWGTGRGSSCSSYILYILGLHNVDSVEYNLDVSEFFN